MSHTDVAQAITITGLVITIVMLILIARQRR